jgi:hypothetical protein
MARASKNPPGDPMTLGNMRALGVQIGVPPAETNRTYCAHSEFFRFSTADIDPLQITSIYLTRAAPTWLCVP